MSIERFILASMLLWLFASVLYVPKDQLRKAFLAHISFQATTWLTSLFLVQYDLITYPVREFPRATGVAFIPQFVFYPTIFAWFIFLFPYNRGAFQKLLHWIVSISAAVWVSYFIGIYTHLSEFKSAAIGILVSFCTFTSQFIICYLYLTWYYKEYNRSDCKQCTLSKK